MGKQRRRQKTVGTSSPGLIEARPGEVFAEDDRPLSLTAQDREAVEDILGMLLRTSKIDFSHYRQPTVLRRIARRIPLSGKKNFAEYLTFLEANPEEAELLFDDLLLSHTEFFRDKAVFDALKSDVFPRLLQERRPKAPIRVWVAGCSSGEEVYSIAISLNEFLAERKSAATAQLFGTDLNQRHIIEARRAVYSEKIRKTVSEERIARCFEETPEGLRVCKQIREMCVFAVQDLTQDPPFPAIDLVSCRNVLIYFDSSLQEIVLPLFHFSLKPEGFLLLGSSESMGKFADLFSPVNQQVNLYSKRAGSGKIGYRFPSGFSSRLQPVRLEPPSVARARSASCGANIDGRIEEILLRNFSPPSLVVDANMQIRQFRGDTSPYLTPAPGEASLKLSKMTREGLMPDIYIAVEEVKKKKERVVKRNVTFSQHDTMTQIDLSVFPVPDPATGETCFLITFQKQARERAPEESARAEKGAPDGEETRLRRELSSIKEHLQSLVDEKDMVNQELWSANEEIQSTNEELQSVNEEMEAAKEELEASNEELRALNEEMQAKNADLKSEKEFSEGLVETAQAIILVLDTEGRIVRYNRYLEELTGYSLPETAGKDWVKAFIPPEDRSAARSLLARAVSGVPTKGNVNPILTKDGRRIETEWFDKTIRDQSGNITGLLAVGQDITERKKVEERLRESEERFSKAFMVSAYALVIAKLEDGALIEVNDAFTKVSGFTREEALAGSTLSLKIWVREEDRQRMVAALREGRSFVRQETLLLAKNGSVKTVLLSAQVIHVRAMPCIISSIEDITERRRIEEELNKTQKLDSLGVLAGGIAHDFNNLMGGIFGYIDLAKDEPDRAKASTYMAKALSAIDRARGLTHQLLTFAKGGAPVMRTGPLFPFVRETAEFALSGANVSCGFDVPSGLRECSFDRSQIGQVVDNIVINAQQAMPSGGRIEVIARNVTLDDREHPALKKGDYVKLSVKDRGTGIPKELLSRVFDPFFTTKTKGHGLGLATCYSIMSRHGGAIDVESEPGKGSTFHLYLPAAAASIPVTSVSPEPGHAGSGTIVVMDDEAVIRDTVANMLKALGYTAICTTGGNEAIEVLSRERKAGREVIGLILDLTVPGGMGGKETVDVVRKTDLKLPVFVVSGYADDPVMTDPADYGFTASICKPFRMAELAAQLKKYLRKG